MEEQEAGRPALAGMIEEEEAATAAADGEPIAEEAFEMTDENDDTDEGRAHVPGPRPGRPASPEPDFLDTRDPACRPAARAEYRRAIEEFRRTGTLQEKVWEDFAHLTEPPGLQVAVYDAHCKACIAIEDWGDEPQDEELGEDAEEPLSSSAAARLPLPVLPELRGVEFDAWAPSQLCSYEEDGPQLPLERPEEPPLPADATTEAMLNAMIGECHFLMREVAFRSMCQARVLEDRMSWVGASMKLAVTGRQGRENDRPAAARPAAEGDPPHLDHHPEGDRRGVRGPQGGRGVTRFRENNPPTFCGLQAVQPQRRRAAGQPQRAQDRPVHG